MLNLVLVGFMGSGKTSVGKQLSNMLNMNLVDTDEIVESQSGMSISEIFAKFGESHFRDLEQKAVEVASNLENCVISTGGGVVLRKKNMEFLKKNGVVFGLSATPEEIYNRISSELHRPLLKTENPLEKVKQLLELRAPYYDQADYMTSTSNKSVHEISEEISQIFLEVKRANERSKCSISE